MLRSLEETFESQVGYEFVARRLASNEDFLVTWRSANVPQLPTKMPIDLEVKH